MPWLARILPIFFCAWAVYVQPSPELIPQAASPGELEAAADRAWARRHEGAEGGRACPDAVLEAITAYRGALALNPARIDLHAKLLEALYYLGDLATTDRESRKQIFAQGRNAFLDAQALLEQRVGRPLEGITPDQAESVFGQIPQAGRLLFWGAVHWGLWGDHHGKMAAVRQGVARKIRDLGELAAAVDEHYEGAGAHRLLGRLHSEAPRVPLFTGWIDRREAIRRLEHAHSLHPENPWNRYYLGDALVRFDKTAWPRGIELIESVATADPRPDQLVGDARAIEDAGRRLSELERSR